MSLNPLSRVEVEVAMESTVALTVGAPKSDASEISTSVSMRGSHLQHRKQMQVQVQLLSICIKGGFTFGAPKRDDKKNNAPGLTSGAKKNDNDIDDDKPASSLFMGRFPFGAALAKRIQLQWWED